MESLILGIQTIKKAKASLFWRTYLLNLFLMVIVIGICWLSASAILPEISKESSKSVTDEAADRVKEQLSVLVNELQYNAMRIQMNPALQTDEESKLLAALDQVATPSLLIDSATVINPKGFVITAYPSNVQYLKGKSFSDRPYFKESLETKKITFSDVLTAET